MLFKPFTTYVSSMLLPILLCRPESKSVWPDLAKFFNFGKIKNFFGNSWRVYLVFSKILYLRWPIFDASGQMFIVCCKWPNIKNSLAIWSHWSISIQVLPKF